MRRWWWRSATTTARHGGTREPSGVLSEGGGHGIIGMRERATMLGGHLQAGPTEKGEFLVTAALPLDSGPAQDES